ncbi:hypothetical protein D3C73_550620 [compost metagenome]
MHDRISDLRISQNMLEGPAAGDDQQDVGDRLDAGGKLRAQKLAIAAAADDQGPGGKQHADQHGDTRIAEEIGYRQQRRTLWQEKFGNRVEKHQQRRQKRRQQAETKARRCLAGRCALRGVLRELVDQPLIRFDLEARGNDRAIDRSAEDDCRNGGDEAVEHGRADIGVERGDRRQRTGMRWHHAVHGGKCRNDRNADIHIG